MEERSCDLLVVGSSISGLMCAAWVKLEQPELDVVVLGPPPEQEKRPYVGESLVEPAILFFRELGMDDQLDNRCALKNGLTYYHKLRIDDPSDRRYTVHAPEILHHKARQLHRPLFDRMLRDHAEQLGVRMLDGLAQELEIGQGGARHRVKAKVGDTSVALSSRWIIDATGRKRLIGNKVSTYTAPEPSAQRSALWIRLADFESFAPHLDGTMRKPVQYDLWYSTHHFMGHANWIWGIPLETTEHKNLISLGLTFLPGLFPRSDEMRTVEHLLAYLDAEHPALAAMVRSGKVLDTSVYRNYLYAAEKVYSTDGWFLIGDAARAVDPLYSTGLTLTSLQSLQVSEMIRRQRGGTLSGDDVAALETAWMKMAHKGQREITDLYAVMHDPMQACMRRYWNVTGWFNGFLPLWWNGFFSTPEGARLVSMLFADEDPSSKSAQELFAKVSEKLGEKLDQAAFDRTSDLDELINLRFDCPLEEVPRHLSRMFSKRAKLRLSLIRLAGWELLPGQLGPLVRDLLTSAAARVAFRRLKLGREAFRAVKAPLHRLIARGSAGPVEPAQPIAERVAA